MRTYIKRPLEIQEQIEILKERGLIFLNEESATNKLKQISYFRLANYWKPMEQDKILHTFKPQSTFDYYPQKLSHSSSLGLHVRDMDKVNVVGVGEKKSVSWVVSMIR